MDDDRRRVREYYQVNLDTGRIFWIAFLVGLVLIGILVVIAWFFAVLAWVFWFRGYT